MTEPEMTPERDAAIRAMLVEHVRTDPAAQAQRRRRRLLGWGGIGVLAIGAAATAGAVLLKPAEVSTQEMVYCLSAAERNADGTYPGSGATIASSDGQGRVDDAIELCTTMWEHGVFEEGFDPTAATNPPGRVPDELQACVMPDGSAAIVPSPNESVCQAIGLAPLAPDD
jgi:hypothetical protein